MCRIVLWSAVAALVVAAAGPAVAGPHAGSFTDVLRATNESITVPPEWDGVWSATDSVYDCNDNLLSVEAYFDTLCAGATITLADQDPTEGLLNITCTGTADATTFNLSCSGSRDVFTDCTLTFSAEASAVRTGESFVGTSTISLTYDGTGEGCDLAPDTCTRTVTRADRIAPAPSEYCTTPVHSSSWGNLKIRYH